MKYLILIVIASILLWRLTLREKEIETEQDEPPADFDALTVAEQIKVANETSRDLESMEQLAALIEACDDDCEIVVRLQWVSNDGQNRMFDLYCNGTNTASECLMQIADREAHDLRLELSYQCRILAKSTRGSGFAGKIANGVRKNTDESVGEWYGEGM